MSIIDQTRDPAFGTLFQLVTRMPALETFVKEASVPDPADLPVTAFAWPDERLFMMHTPEQAALSYAYAKTASAVPKFVMATLEKALEVYGIPADTFAETKVAAAPEPTYLVPDLHLFPVSTKEDVKTAQLRLVENLHKLDLDRRAEACANLIKIADEHGVELHPEVQKLAGLVVSDVNETRRWLEARASATPVDTFKVAYQRLADGLKGLHESGDRPGLIKLSGTIAELDARAGLVKHYDRQLPDPIRTVFNTTKVAANTVDVAGALIPIQKLAALPSSFWEDLGGSELSDELAPGGTVDVSKLAAIIGTLPLDLKVILRRQLRA